MHPHQQMDRNTQAFPLLVPLHIQSPGRRLLLGMASQRGFLHKRKGLLNSSFTFQGSGIIVVCSISMSLSKQPHQGWYTLDDTLQGPPPTAQMACMLLVWGIQTSKSAKYQEGRLTFALFYV